MKIIPSRTTFVLLSNFRKCSYVVFIFLTVLLQAQLNTIKIVSNVIENDDAAIDKSEKGQSELYISTGTAVYDLDNSISAKLIPINPKKGKINERKVVVAKLEKKLRDNPKRTLPNSKSRFTIAFSEDCSFFSKSVSSSTNVILSISNFQLKAVPIAEKVWSLLKFEEIKVFDNFYKYEILRKFSFKSSSIRPPPKSSII